MRQISYPLARIRTQRPKEITMRLIAFVLALVLAACSPAERTASEATPPPAPQSEAPPAWPDWPDNLPVYDHIVIVVEEKARDRARAALAGHEVVAELVQVPAEPR